MSFYTNSGKMIDMAKPDMDSFCGEDIAHALSMVCRATGNFRHFYSVAQHSLNCMREAQARGFSQRVCFACLLHDASEAYLCDVPTPLKELLPDYRKIEKAFQREIFKKFGLYPLSGEEERMVKIIDEALLYYEFKCLHTIPICFEKTPQLCSVPNVEKMDMGAVEQMMLREINAFERLIMTTWEVG
ncbi:MAG: HD domain-containing protein [Clostridia bacterium]|nr:HD domain-containing protein [Clostridia bacterium]